jgi:hypothetical protein
LRETGEPNAVFLLGIRGRVVFVREHREDGGCRGGRRQILGVTFFLDFVLVFAGGFVRALLERGRLVFPANVFAFGIFAACLLQSSTILSMFDYGKGVLGGGVFEYTGFPNPGRPLFVQRVNRGKCFN